jgi:hypothetical protein
METASVAKSYGGIQGVYRRDSAASRARPWLPEQARQEADIALTLNMREGHDRSCLFMSTFTADHIAWRAMRLKL